MKKIYLGIVTILCTVLIISSCAKRELGQNIPKGSIDTTNGLEDEVSYSEKSQSDGKKIADKGNNNLFKSVNFDYDTSCLTLVDQKLNKVIKKFPLEKNSFVKNIYEFDKGYLAMVAYADTPVEVETVNDIKFVNEPKKITNYALQIFDSQLNLKKQIDLKGIMPKELMGSIHSAAASEDGEKIIWTLQKRLYIFETSDGKLSKILDEENNNVYFSNVSFSKDNKSIVFSGNSSNTEEGDCTYGLFSFDSKKLILYTEKKYRANSIYVSPKFACFCDYVDARKQVSSGKVPILDLTTKTTFTMQVDGNESTMTKVSEDGQYLLAVKEVADGSYRIRQYRLRTGELIKEESIKSGEEALDLEYTGNSSEYALICTNKDRKLSYYYFTCEDK